MKTKCMFLMMNGGEKPKSDCLSVKGLRENRQPRDVCMDLIQVCNEGAPIQRGVGPIEPRCLIIGIF